MNTVIIVTLLVGFGFFLGWICNTAFEGRERKPKVSKLDKEREKYRSLIRQCDFHLYQEFLNWDLVTLRAANKRLEKCKTGTSKTKSQ